MGWKEMKTGTKAGIIGGTVAAVLLIALVPTAIILSNKMPKDLVLWTGWTEGGVQASALEDVVDKYNDNNGDHKDVDVKYVEGYGAAGKSFKLDIDAGKKGIKKMPDLYIDYDGAMAILAGYGDNSFALDLSQGENAVSKDLFVEGLITTGDQIEGVQNNEGLYSIPIGKSSEMLSINAPALIMMLNDWVAAGGTVEATGTIWNQILDAAGGAQDGLIANEKYTKDGTYEINPIELESTGEGKASTSDIYSVNNGLYESLNVPTEINGKGVVDMPTTASDQLELANASISQEDKDLFRNKYEIKDGATLQLPDGAESKIVINDDTFKEYDTIFGIGNQLFDMYVKAGTINKNIDLYSHSFIALDATSNYFSMAITAHGGQESSIKDGVFQFDAIEDSTSKESYQLAYESAFKAINSGALLAKGNNSQEPNYTNSTMTNHGTVMVVGSTAGASHNYDYDTNKDGSIKLDGAGKGEVVMTSAPTKLMNADTTETNINQGPNMGAIDRSSSASGKMKKEYEARENETKNFINYLVGKDTYDFEGKGSKETPGSYLSNKSGYLVGTKEVMGIQSDKEGNSFIDSITSDGKNIKPELMNGGSWQEDGKYKQGFNKYKLGPALAYQNFSTNSLQKEAYGVNSDEFRNLVPKGLKDVRDGVIDGSIPANADSKASWDAWFKDLQDEAYKNGWIDTTSSKDGKVIITNKNY